MSYSEIQILSVFEVGATKMEMFRRIALLICYFTISQFSLALGQGEPKHCGIGNNNPFSDRIVGGVDTEPHEFPWLTKIFRLRSFHCGGSLITDRHVLTAGHCASSWKEGSSMAPKKTRSKAVNTVMFEPDEFICELGGHYFKEKAKDVTRRDVKQIFLHPDYDLFAVREIMVQTNDIALFKFDPVTFSRNIAPICLPGKDSAVRDAAKLVVAGWGSINTETIDDQLTEMPKAAQKTEIMKIPYDTCQKNKFVGWLLTEDNGLTEKAIFCGLGNNTDSCRGDSGGAAMLKTKEGFIVAGIVSWGIGCNQKDYPAAYTRVSSFIDFIDVNTKDGVWLPTLKAQ